jgi:hypothetical protein
MFNGTLDTLCQLQLRSVSVIEQLALGNFGEGSERDLSLSK